ncbi:19405_t:CDS:1 [Gigaspora rosea]|nr:19405_t:CDS:1 [Gigaspora rosea]
MSSTSMIVGNSVDQVVTLLQEVVSAVKNKNRGYDNRLHFPQSQNQNQVRQKRESRPLICYAYQQLGHMACNCLGLSNDQNNENRNNSATVPQTNIQTSGGMTTECSP